MYRSEKRIRLLVVMLLAIVSLPSHLEAASPLPQPATNLGTTSFLDGEGGLGWLVEIIGSGYGAAQLNDANGNRLPGRNRQSIAGLAVHPVYGSEIKFLGGNLGIDAVIPLVYLDNDFAGTAARAADIGDITVSPFIQWSKLNLLDRMFSMRIGLQVVAPTGHYAPTDPASIGQNIWQFSPYYAFTWRTSESWEISGRLTYDWSSSNQRPPAALQAISAQPGDQLALNLSASYAISEQWRVGIASYSLHQLSDTKVNGIAISESRQRVFGVGPGLRWSSGPSTVIANFYREFGAQSRAEGYQAILRVLYAF